MDKQSGILSIGNGCDWSFVNGDWRDGETGLIEVPEAKNDFEQFHYAFNRESAYGDVRVKFEFLLTPHSDIGVVLRAKSESSFRLLHLPNCAQAFRAQHFWAALSKMDSSGYLRHVKLEMVRRVPSNPEVWLTAEVSLVGSKVSVVIGDHGSFEAQDEEMPETGHIGLFMVGGAQIRNVTVEGTPANSDWDETVHQAQNWFFPLPGTEYGLAQKTINLLRLPDGELVINLVSQERSYDGKSTPLLIRSGDNGHTWTDPEPLQVLPKNGDWLSASLHLTPAGRMIAILRTGDQKNLEGYRAAESQDGGRTWSQPEALDFGPMPEKMKTLSVQSPVNLSDGSMISFMLGVYDLSDPDLPIGVWGAHHIRAFCARSTDDGRTWSAPVSVDNSAGLGTTVMTGNLDLTEVSGAETGDGKIMALIRPIYSPWMWETWSTDKGQSWGPCVRGPFPGYAAPKMLRTASGKLLVAHRMPSMTIHCSQDDGHTWDQGTQIDAALWVMGEMLEVEPDLVLYVYRTEGRMRAQFIRVTDSGLVPVSR